jgi:hypothetical protein
VKKLDLLYMALKHKLYKFVVVVVVVVINQDKH